MEPTEGETVLPVGDRRPSPEGRENGGFSSGSGVESRPYCDLCKEAFLEDDDLRAHCATAAHRGALLSDDGRDWKFRPPPRGVSAEDFLLCEGYATYGTCRLGRECCEAHGEHELAEWKERFRYRQQRVDRARERRLVGGYLRYAEDLLRRYREAEDPTSVLTENLRGLRLTHRPDLRLTLTSKTTEQEWCFKLKTVTPLRRLVLLEDSFRQNFCLKKVAMGPFEFTFAGNERQEWVSTLRAHGDEPKVYRIQVAFRASMYATFEQLLAFDFGGEPVLVRRLSVDAVDPAVLHELQEKRRAVVSREGRWTAAAVDLVRCEEDDDLHFGGATGAALLERYAAPDPVTFRVTQGLVLEKLTKNNYAARMHELLDVEELTRADIVGQYNIQAFLELRDTMETSTRHSTQTRYARGGELYARLDLEADLTEDTPAGRLVLSGCKKAWLSPLSNPLRTPDGKRRVYEATVEHVQKKSVYLRLSKSCVRELDLSPQTQLGAEVQFHLNRMALCEMHYAVDKLSPTSLVFPDFSLEPDPSDDEGVEPDVAEGTSALNVHQRRAAACIASPRDRADVPPVLVVGPFGTGKTFTLAHALLRVLQQSDTRVLICTHSNSAADLYVLDYLDAYAKDHPEARPLRVLHEYRLPSRHDPRLFSYCLQTPPELRTSRGPWFRQPTLDEMERHRVVVITLASSRMLLASGIRKGFFSHIMVDEAAQALEVQCILPLALADRRTRLVFAGDYMQLNPDVYSVVARECKFHVSLLERLHDLYPAGHPCKVLLRDNYRSHEDLVRYASECFYENRLRASGRRVRHPRFHPLTFFAARGCDVGDGTSFYNGAEVREVCDRVREIVDGWPREWGTADLGDVLVVAPYREQVARIRDGLRAVGFSDVKVESVANVQGKECRVVILSTVRTRATCIPVEESAPVKEALDFGFLSNSKLLNTALTRAQSLVAVVGDPVTLCSLGACRKLWEKFIKACGEAGSLFNTSWVDISDQLNGIELAREYGLNPRAQAFTPSKGDPSPVGTRQRTAPPQWQPMSSVDRRLLEDFLLYIRNNPPPSLVPASASQIAPHWYPQRPRSVASASRFVERERSATNREFGEESERRVENTRPDPSFYRGTPLRRARPDLGTRSRSAVRSETKPRPNVSETGDDYLSRMMSGGTESESFARCDGLRETERRTPPSVTSRAPRSAVPTVRADRVARGSYFGRASAGPSRVESAFGVHHRVGQPPVATVSASKVRPTVAFVKNVGGPVQWDTVPEKVVTSDTTDVRQLYREFTREDGRRADRVLEHLRNVSYADVVKSASQRNAP